MSKGPKREATDLRLILRFIQELSNVESVERVYGAALNAVQEIFKPNRAFIALSDAGGSADDAHSTHPGWVSDLAFPIYAGQELLGRFVLQYDEIRSFSDHDAALMEIVAAQAGLAIERIQQEHTVRRQQRQKDELVAMAAHELRSPLTAIVGATFLLRVGRSDERVRALEMIERNA